MLLCIITIFLCHLITKAEKMVHMETSKIQTDLSAFQKNGRVEGHVTHEVIFAVKQRNIDLLQERLFDVSNPTSINYRRHLNRDQINEISGNPNATQSVLKYLDSIGAKIKKKSKYGEYIHATASVSLWENSFSTSFFEFQHRESKKKYIRSLHYSLPEELSNHISAVFNTVQIPIISGSRKTFRMGTSETLTGGTYYIYNAISYIQPIIFFLSFLPLWILFNFPLYIFYYRKLYNSKEIKKEI